MAPHESQELKSSFCYGSRTSGSASIKTPQALNLLDDFGDRREKCFFNFQESTLSKAYVPYSTCAAMALMLATPLMVGVNCGENRAGFAAFEVGPVHLQLERRQNMG